MKYTYAKVTKTNWISYILNITGWETGFGEFFTEVHFTMPKDFNSKSDMANYPHITITTKDGWVIHRYENNKRKYASARRLVKIGKTAYQGEASPESSNETNIVRYISDDLATMKRP